jgi:hypothetical protein
MKRILVISDLTFGGAATVCRWFAFSTDIQTGPGDSTDSGLWRLSARRCGHLPLVVYAFAVALSIGIGQVLAWTTGYAAAGVPTEKTNKWVLDGEAEPRLRESLDKP